jgi:hypothetical protein
MLGQVRLAGGPGLAQVPPAPFQVVILDPRGTPWAGARVTVLGMALPQTTNSQGVAIFPSVPLGQVTVNVELGDYRMSASGDSSNTLFITAPVCSPGPVASKVELIGLFGGTVMALVGSHFKTGPVQLIGETLIGAAVFSALYRNSCRWM